MLVAADFRDAWLKRKTMDLIELSLLPNRPMILEQGDLVSIQELKPVRQSSKQAAVLPKAHCS